MSRIEKAKEFRKLINANLQATRKLIRVDELSEDELLDMIDLYESYQVDKLYKVDDIFKYEGKLYKVIQEHTSQEDWIPADLPALYRHIQPANVVAHYDPNRDYSANPFQPGERIIWTDDKIYESIHSSPHAWTPADYPAAWKVIE